MVPELSLITTSSFNVLANPERLSAVPPTFTAPVELLKVTAVEPKVVLTEVLLKASFRAAIADRAALEKLAVSPLPAEPSEVRVASRILVE